MSDAYTRFVAPRDAALLPIDHQPQMGVVDLLQPHSIFGAVQIPYGAWANRPQKPRRPLSQVLSLA